MKKWGFYVVVSLQVLFLVLMSVSYYVMDVFGESIQLETAPVDPRDPFYGDYVTLAYEIESVPGSKWEGKTDIERGDKVFLLLGESDSGIHQLITASDVKMETNKNQILLESKMEWYNEITNVYQVDIGLGRYYIEENSGAALEQGIENRVVEIILAPWGQKKISSIEKSSDT